jgi:trehalose 6-phosphate phosphatase
LTLSEYQTVLDRGPAPPPPLDPSRTALFLDLDGTLAPIAPHPGAVGPSAALTDLLRKASARLDGRLAVVSGRSLEDIDRILEGAVTAAAAVHGLVRRSASGSVLARAPHPGLNYARIKLDRLTDRPGVLLEDKGLGLAVHYRKAPAAEEAVIRNCRAIAETTGLVLQLGRMVAELRTPGADKGESVRAFMAEPPFSGATPVFVGDDLTDEDGFTAAAELGGYGVLVGETRDTAARHGLSDVEAVLGWLGALA